MNLPVYRSSVEYKEILRLLQKASMDNQNFVWQTFESHRVVLAIEHFEFDFVSREVVLTLAEKGVGLDKSKPVYVKLDHRNSVFKVPSFKTSKSSIQFAFPLEVKTEELRQHSRMNFTKEKTVSLRPSLGNQRDSAGGLNVRVTDVSEFGLGLVVSEHNRSFLKNNRILWLTHLETHELRYPVLAEVVYISSESSRKTKDLKVGLKLSGILPEETLSKFVQ